MCHTRRRGRQSAGRFRKQPRDATRLETYVLVGTAGARRNLLSIGGLQVEPAPPHRPSNAIFRDARITKSCRGLQGRFPSGASNELFRRDCEISSADYCNNFGPARSLTAFRASTTLDVLNRSHCWHRGGEFFAETHVSTESAPSPQNTRFSHAHEDCRRPQGFGGATQKGTPSSYAHLENRNRPPRRTRRGRVFPAPCVC